MTTIVVPRPSPFRHPGLDPGSRCFDESHPTAKRGPKVSTQLDRNLLPNPERQADNHASHKNHGSRKKHTISPTRPNSACPTPPQPASPDRLFEMYIRRTTCR